MIKKDLLDFIERVENKAVKSVTDRWSEKIEAKKNEVMAPYIDKLKLYQDTFNRFSTNLTNMLTDMSEDEELKYSADWRLNEALSRLSTIEDRIRDNSVFAGEVEKLRQQGNKEIKDVRDNYKKVYIVSKTMTTKKISEYLEGLGFDLSTLKEDEMKYLSTDIDKSKLFVCGERH